MPDAKPSIDGRLRVTHSYNTQLKPAAAVAMKVLAIAKIA